MKNYERIDELMNYLKSIDGKEYKVGHDISNYDLLSIEKILKEEKRIMNDIEELKQIKKKLKELEYICNLKYSFISSQRREISFSKSHTNIFTIKVPDFLIDEAIERIYVSCNDQTDLKKEQRKVFESYSSSTKLSSCLTVMEENHTLDNLIKFMHREVEE